MIFVYAIQYFEADAMRFLRSNILYLMPDSAVERLFVADIFR